MKIFTAICLVVLLVGCDNKPLGQASGGSKAPESKPKIEFNTTDKSITTNGNIAVAFAKYIESANKTDGPVAVIMQASEITKSPYSNMGKLVRVKGRIYKIEELPPDKDLPGRMYEVLMLTGNPNSALGATTVDCLCAGEMTKANSGQVATCGGYFVGTYESPNAMGGMVEALTIVGAIAKTK